MTLQEATDLLTVLHFQVRTGEMILQLTESYQSREPILLVHVSDQHQCIDPDCHGYHLIGTKTALSYMSERALRAMIEEELLNNR